MRFTLRIFNDPLEEVQVVLTPEAHFCILGRNVLTNVTDMAVSRRHVLCVADFEKMEIRLLGLGKSPVILSDGASLYKGEWASEGPLSTFWLLDGKYPIEIFCESC